MDFQELERREKELELRIKRIEEVEKELMLRMGEIEKKFNLKNLKKKRLSSKRRLGLIEVISKEPMGKTKIPPPKSRIGLSTRGKILENRMRRHILDLDERMRSIPEEKPTEEVIQESKESMEERREILKKQIRDIARKSSSEKSEKDGEGDESKEQVRELRELKIAVEKDARLLLKILLKEGVIKLEDARKQLGVDKETIEGWVMDLKEIGVIETIENPWGVDLKLRSVDIAMKKRNRKI